MTHHIQDLSLPPSSLQSAIQIDPNLQNQVHQSQHPSQQIPPPTKKRKKLDGASDEPSPSTEPRRLRRSHEACSRCRSKKIKCDSKLPRCTACATAGTPCNQEDRHRQKLTPRGHTQRIEIQVMQCEALLKRHIPGFELNDLDDICSKEGIDVSGASPNVSAAFQFQHPSIPEPSSSRPSLQLPGSQVPKGYTYTPSTLIPQTYPLPMYGPPVAPYPNQYNPNIHPVLQQHQMPPPVAALPSPTSPIAQDIRGQDPQSNDMSNSQALAKSFGVSAAIMNDIQLATLAADKEDLGVGSGDLASGRDRTITEIPDPREPSKWLMVSMRRNSFDISLDSKLSSPSHLNVWLPKDRKMVNHVVDIYFTKLNIHRPILIRKDFDRTLDALYDGLIVLDDAGYICSLYLILALGTMSELSYRAIKDETSASKNKLVPKDWPTHDEFFERAMFVKPFIGMSISGLQSLILLHWYLYTERQGRTLWRLVGSLVRISIELGLHHDPTSQGTTFTEEECQLRIRLWAIVMVHDRGTSILLGRPLAISPFDSHTPPPSRAKTPEISEHFVLSSPIAGIQADIINSLYMPTRQSGDAIMRHATRIIKSFKEFKRNLPEPYRVYFGGTEEMSLERRVKVVQDITEDQGLTLLKIGIARILLLRVLFNSKELSYMQRHKALVDAIVTSHNIIVVHNQLIRFPDIAFFTSPIPLHIAAMVILYGHMSQCNRLSKQVAVEDIWMALDMLPRLRWRWERKDVNGGHPLISKLAEKVLDVNLSTVGPVPNPVLLAEQDWEDISIVSPSSSATLPSAASTPPLTSTMYAGNGPMVYGPQQRDTKPLNGSVKTTQQLVDVPSGLFYPFFPEIRTEIPGRFEGAPVNRLGLNHDFSHLLAAAAAAQPDVIYGGGEGSFVEPGGSWIGVHPNTRPMQYPIPQP